MTKQLRNNGPVGALLDEYEKALIELDDVIKGVNIETLTAVVDHETNDPDCQSIQSVLSHIIQSGYTYVIEIRRFLGDKENYIEGVNYDSVAEYQTALKNMFKYNEQLFTDYPDLKIVAQDPTKKIKVRWGQLYDVEQLFEHAIVHVLRHRRQIERFLIQLK